MGNSVVKKTEVGRGLFRNTLTRPRACLAEAADAHIHMGSKSLVYSSSVPVNEFGNLLNV